MNIRLIGAAVIVLVCGGLGFHMAAAHRTDMLYLRGLMAILDFMECELNYRLTPLPRLCRQIASEHPKTLGPFFLYLSDTLDSQVCADVVTCMGESLRAFPRLPRGAAKCLTTLGETLGCYDLEGQLKGLKAVREESRRIYESLDNNKDARLRSYQILGICSGAALAIILL